MPGNHSRRKGAQFERQVATELRDLTGIKFARNLRQYQESGDDDLRADCEDWPFSIECKRYALATTCRAGWKEQAVEAAQKDGKLPAVVWRGDRMETRVTVQMRAFCASMPDYLWADLNMEGFALLAREIMSGDALSTHIPYRGQVS